MPTVADAIAAKIDYHRRELSRYADRRRLIPDSMLTLDVPCDRVWTYYRSGTETLEIMYVTSSKEVQRTAATFIMDTLDISDAVKELDTTGDPSISFADHPNLPGIKIMVERSPDCHRARVTQESTIEYCGSLDESKYLSVDYLDLEQQLTIQPLG